MEDGIERVANQVIGAAIEVHKSLGPGYLESVYEEALSVELKLRDIRFERQLVFALDYKGHSVGEGRLDFLVERSLIVELKAVEALSGVHTAQVISYLKATHKRLALLINFHEARLVNGIKRVVL